jgi:hypothetical protein
MPPGTVRSPRCRTRFIPFADLEEHVRQNCCDRSARARRGDPGSRHATRKTRWIRNSDPLDGNQRGMAAPCARESKHLSATQGAAETMMRQNRTAAMTRAPMPAMPVPIWFRGNDPWTDAAWIIHFNDAQSGDHCGAEWHHGNPGSTLGRKRGIRAYCPQTERNGQGIPAIRLPAPDPVTRAWNSIPPHQIPPATA